jgi:hypothetical protein
VVTGSKPKYYVHIHTSRREASKHFREKGRNINTKVDELETNIENVRDFYRGIIDFKKGNQRRTNIVNDEKLDLMTHTHTHTYTHTHTHTHSSLARWRDHFSQLLNMHGVNEVKQTDTYSRTTSA